MSFIYGSLANTPCCIIRSGQSSVMDTDLALRVGANGCALPTGWDVDNGVPYNPVFFDKLKAASRKLVGAVNDAALSAKSINGILYQVQSPNTSYLESLTGSFPDGELLSFPFFENIGAISQELSAPFQELNVVVFEDTGGTSAPTYADLHITIDDGSSPANGIYIVKLFHSLTT